MKHITLSCFALITSLAAWASTPSELMIWGYETPEGRSVELSFRVWDNAYVEITGGAANVPAVAFDMYSTITIPSRIDRWPVRVIGDWAFCGLRNLKKVDIPSSVVHIGYGAFQGSGLESVIIPGSVWSLGQNYEFEKLRSGSYVPFDDMSGWTGWLMAYCSEVYEEAMRYGTQYWIEHYTQHYDVPWGLINAYDEIGGVFANCNELKEVVIEPNQPAARYACQEGYDLYTYPEVRTIGKGTFKGCSKLVSVSLPDDLTAIGETVFQDCTSLVSFHIPADVWYLSGESFVGCTALESFEVSEDNFDFAEVDGVLYNFECDRLVKVPGAKATVDTIQILDGVKSIGPYAFANCRGLVDAVIPDGINLANIIKVVTNESLRVLGGNGATHESWSRNVASNVSSIVDTMIQNNGDPSVLTHDQVVITENSCSNKFVSLSGSESFVKYRGKSFINGIEEYELCEEYRSSFEEVEGVQLVSDFSVGQEIASGPVGLFYDCPNLKSAILGADCSVVQNDMFKGCSSLEEVVFKGRVKWIGNNAFYGCAVLPSMSIPEGVEQIGYGAFSGCRKIQQLVFPASLAALGDVNEWGLDMRSDDIRFYSQTSNMSWTGRLEFSAYHNLQSDVVTENGGSPSELSDRRDETYINLSYDSYESSSLTKETDRTIWLHHKSSSDYCRKNLELTENNLNSALTNIHTVCGNELQHSENESVDEAPKTITVSEMAKTEKKRCSLFAGCSSLSNITFLGNAPTKGRIASEICYGAPGRMTVTLPMESTGWDDKYIYANIPGRFSGNSLSAKDILSADGHKIEYAFDEKQSIAVYAANSRPVAVPREWLSKYGILDAVTDNGRLSSITSNAVPSEAETHGDTVLPRSLYSSYVLGLNPVADEDEFRANIEIVDGEVVVSWSPELPPEEAAKRKYTVYGCTELGGEWVDVDEASEDIKPLLRFFKVAVEMR